MALRQRARALLRGPEIHPAPRPRRSIAGHARLGRRTKDLVKRLGPGDVAIIDHPDLDRIAAEELVRTGVPVVINVSASSTGRYPNAGPTILARGGVKLLDAPAAPLFDELDDGEEIVVQGAEVRRNGTLLATGRVIDLAEASEQMERHRARVDDAIAAFATNTIEHLEEEGELLGGRLELPKVRTRFRDRHALVVVRGANYRRDLEVLRAYIEDTRPVLVGVDGGADAILEAGFKPDVVLGDMDSATDSVLRCGAELIVHAYRDGRAPGRERLEQLGLEHVVAPAVGTSEDVAMLLAHEQGAELIVSVGAHFNLTEFLDKNRSGMSSTFLTRLRIGETLVDAKGVSRLYNPGVRGWQLGLFIVAALFLVAIVVVSAPALGELAELIWLRIKVLLGI
ncbi:MAG TPA: putative cytokinetic ring protein SteA [Solirubrobacterales bacterium]|nr:putative cytokinetic ring protein SteA [Solirubrobacterales bacterium]